MSTGLIVTFLLTGGCPLGTIRLMDLALYLSRKKISVSDFAKMIGVHRSSVVRFRDKIRRPDLGTVQRIHEATGGKVTAKDFFDNQSSEAAGAKSA